jgi:hypothetical protein
MYAIAFHKLDTHADSFLLFTVVVDDSALESTNNGVLIDTFLKSIFKFYRRRDTRIKSRHQAFRRAFWLSPLTGGAK